MKETGEFYSLKIISQSSKCLTVAKPSFPAFSTRKVKVTDLVLDLVDAVPAEPPVVAGAQGKGQVFRLLGQAGRPRDAHELLPVYHLQKGIINYHSAGKGKEGSPPPCPSFPEPGSVMIWGP